MRREITPHHASSTSPAHEEALEMARPRLDRLIQTPLLLLLLRHLFVEASVAAAVEAISNFVAAAAAGEIWTIVICSEENALLPFRAGRREIRGTSLASPATHVNRVNHANQRGGTRDASKEETRSADQNGPSESETLTAYGEIRPSLASKTELPTTLLRAVLHIRHQHRM